MGVVVGYARVSSTDQDLEVQLAQLQEAGCTKIFSEKVSAVKYAERRELDKCLNYLRDGDVLVITRLDRLARSVKHFSEVIETLSEKQVGFRCIQQPIDTTSSTGRLMMQMLAAFAEFELVIRKERQAEGIAKAKERGVYKHSNSRTFSPQKLAGARRMFQAGAKYPEVSFKTGIHVDSLYELFPEYKNARLGRPRKSKPVEAVEPLQTPVVEPIPDIESQVQAVTGIPDAKKPGFLGKFLGPR